MAMDISGRRLITGGRDGCLKIWNYNNGQCLKILAQRSSKAEICAVSCFELHKNRYIVGVGWNKRVNIYTDSMEDISQVQFPIPHWADDISNGHTQDILSVQFCAPNFLATSSYDGEVIVWNMVSGHVFCYLHSPLLEQSIDTSNQLEAHQLTDVEVSSVLFLDTRIYNKDAASVIASGPLGHIHFWNIFNNGQLLTHFYAPKSVNSIVTAMVSNQSNSRLCYADSNGYICIRDISTYCLEGHTQQPPKVIAQWRGHTDNVTHILLVESHDVLVTSSLDCTVRVFTYAGEYVGTYGQPNLFDIHNPSTYQHPLVPYDVLVDPSSLPEHPSLLERESTYDIIHEDSMTNVNKAENNEQVVNSFLSKSSSKQPVVVDQSTVKQLINTEAFQSSKGKRLRQEKLKPGQRDFGGQNHHQMLICFPLAPIPQPQMLSNRNTPLKLPVLDE